ncbi:hypothetical protein [Paenibacillus plantarum]|uniref:hypothetical protein n=1 Tax=Paenibacillus plantarum TaxID=2654975 RepID=UPI001492E752|nr:hypothetical protein [Paenibacillus plantarum]
MIGVTLERSLAAECWVIASICGVGGGGAGGADGAGGLVSLVGLVLELQLLVILPGLV